MTLEPIPPTSIEPKLLLLYGPPKVGKSTLLSLLQKRRPGYVFSFDPTGYSYLTAAYDYYSSSEAVIAGARTLAALPPDQHKPQWLGLDPVGRLEDLCAESALVTYKKRFPGTAADPGPRCVADLLALPYWSGYNYLREEFVRVLTAVGEVGLPVIFIAHVRVKALDKTEQSTNTKDLDLSFGVAKLLCSTADVIGFLSRSRAGAVSLVTTTANDSANVLNCGSRFPYLSNKTIALSEQQKDGSVVDHWERVWPSLVAIGTPPA